MRELRCVGGPSAGKVFKIANGQEWVRIAETAAVASDWLTAGCHAHVVNECETRYTVYRVHSVDTPGGAVDFLAPAGMDAIDQLRELVAGYRR